MLVFFLVVCFFGGQEGKGEMGKGIPASTSPDLFMLPGCLLAALSLGSVRFLAAVLAALFKEML